MENTLKGYEYTIAPFGDNTQIKVKVLGNSQELAKKLLEETYKSKPDMMIVSEPKNSNSF